MSDNVPEIIRLEQDADKLESDASDLRWEISRLIYEELESGTRGKDLAEQIGKSPAHVSLIAKTWRVYLGKPDRPPWNKAYHSAEVRGRSGPKSGLESEPEPEPITDKDAIAKSLASSGGFRKWLMSQGQAEMTETDDLIRLVVWKY